MKISKIELKKLLQKLRSVEQEIEDVVNEPILVSSSIKNLIKRY